jgi:hypothetical protein
MITSLILALVTVSIMSYLLVGNPDQEQAYAQTQVTNFTQLFSTNKEFQLCPENIPGLSECLPVVNVLYHLVSYDFLIGIARV